MRRVLCLFYYFPPSGGAGALRCLAFARGLAAHGWHPTVIAPEGCVYPTRGDELLARIPHDVRVVRTGNLDLKAPLAILRRLGASHEAVAGIGRALFVPDPHWGWAPFARRAAERALREAPHHALLSFGAPWTAHLTALGLSRRHRLPWVASFADEWSTVAWVRFPTPFHRRLHRRWEGRVLARADAVTIPTAGMARRLAAAHPGIARRIDLVDNGHDEADFSGRTGRLAERFTLLYAGTMYAPTAPDAVLGALARALAAAPARRARVRLRVLGWAEPRFAERARRLGLGDVVSLEGPRPHGEAVQAMLDAHALVVALADQPNAAAMHPVKLFEYLRAGRHILAFLPDRPDRPDRPDGDAAALLEGREGCARVRPGDAAGAASVIETWLSQWESGKWPEAPLHRKGLERLSREAQSAALAAALDRVVEHRR